MTRLSAGGVLRGAVVVAALAVFPFVFPEHWVLNIAVFTLMYAALATSWNLVGGFTGYISLGNVAFFGLGAYAVAILFTKHMSVGSGYRPFYVLPLIGLAVGLVSVPIGWIAFRTRAATFAIVTLTLIFVAQQLAFNLHSLTNGSTGILLPLPPFSERDVRAAVLLRDARVARPCARHLLVGARQQARPGTVRDPRRRGPRPGPGAARDRRRS